MITRADYRADKSLFWAYYLEIARAAGVSLSPDLLKLVKASTDEFLNDIPLPIWVRHAEAYAVSINTAMHARGDSYFVAGGVCTCKALAKHLAQQASQTPRG